MTESGSRSQVREPEGAASAALVKAGRRPAAPADGAGKAAGEADADAAAAAQALYERLVREHYRLVYAVCFKVLRSATDAEDATQEAFLKAYRCLGDLRDPEVAVGWLCRIARNAALDRGRRRGRQGRLVAEVVEQAEVQARTRGPREEPEPVYDDERERLLAAVAELPEAEGVVVTLRFLEGLEPQDIAARLGEKPTTVRVRLHRALKRLRGRLAAGDGVA